jgi:hypothetical protein
MLSFDESMLSPQRLIHLGNSLLRNRFPVAQKKSMHSTNRLF